MKQKYPKYVFTAFETQSNVTWVFWAMSFNDGKRSPMQIPPYSVVGQEITTLNACRIGGILSIEIIFLAEVI